MAKLIYVGRNDDNYKGMSSKAYTIRRSGRKVVARYGSVQTLGGGGGKLHWVARAPREKHWTFSTTQKAARFVREKIAEKEDNNYERLSGRVRIRAAILL